MTYYSFVGKGQSDNCIHSCLLSHHKALLGLPKHFLGRLRHRL